MKNIAFRRLGKLKQGLNWMEIRTRPGRLSEKSDGAPG